MHIIMKVPAGCDWRRFFFPALKAAKMLVPILSRSFLFSNACEDEVTYAVNRRIPIVPVLHDLDDGFAEVMASPESFVADDEDIHFRVPKLQSILDNANRLPNKGRFDDNWDQNIQVLCDRIYQIVSSSPSPAPSPLITGQVASHEDAPKSPLDISRQPTLLTLSIGACVQSLDASNDALLKIRFAHVRLTLLLLLFATPVWLLLLYTPVSL